MIPIITLLILFISVFDPGIISTITGWFTVLIANFGDSVPDITQSTINFQENISVSGVASAIKTFTPITATLALAACIFQSYNVMRKSADKKLLIQIAETFAITVILIIVIGPAISGASSLSQKIQSALINQESVISNMNQILLKREAELKKTSSERIQLVNIATAVGDAGCIGQLSLQSCLGGKYKEIFNQISLYTTELGTWIQNNLAELIALTTYTSAMILVSIAFIGKTALLLTLFAIHAFVLPFFIFENARGLVSGYLKLIGKLLILHPILILIIFLSSQLAVAFADGFSAGGEDKVGLIIAALIFAAIAIITKSLITSIGKNLLENIKSGSNLISTGLSEASSELLSLIGNKLQIQSLQSKQTRSESTAIGTNHKKEENAWQGANFSQVKKAVSNGSNSGIGQINLKEVKAGSFSTANERQNHQTLARSAKSIINSAQIVSGLSKAPADISNENNSIASEAVKTQKTEAGTNNKKRPALKPFDKPEKA